MTLEEKLHESLRVVAREVEVSPQELAHAEHRMLHRRGQLLARRRRHHRLTAAAAVGGLLVAGALGWSQLASEPQPASIPAPAPAPEPVPQVVPVSVDALAGVWLAADASGSLWSFHRDGTVSWAEPGLAGVDAGPADPAVDYSLTDTGVDLPDDRCDWDLHITDDGRMTGTVSGPDETLAGPCAEARWQSWVRLSPRSEAGAELVFTGTDTAGIHSETLRLHHGTVPVQSEARVSRTWLQQGTGRLLQITRAEDGDGFRYVLDDGGELVTNPDDVGSVVLDDTGALVLTSSEDSRGCPEGSAVRLADLALRGSSGTYPPRPAPGLEVVAEPAQCGLHQVLGGIWVQVSS